jgi:DNA-binding protein HU-beta
MNKSELVASIATKSKLTKKDSEMVLNAFIEIVGTTLKKREKITLIGFGTFEARKRAARKGMNPQTKEELKIPAKTVPIFKPGSALKELVNTSKKKKN